MVVTITDVLQLEAATILELLGNLPPGPVIGHPAERGETIGAIHLVEVEARHHTHSGNGQSLPEADPLEEFRVLINSFALSEVQVFIGLHAGRLHERLILVARVHWCTLQADDSLDGLLTHFRVTESIGNVGELLVVGSLNFPLVATIVIVVGGGSSLVEHFLVANFLGLREPSAVGFPPSVVVLEEAIVQVGVLVAGVLILVETGRHVADFVEVAGADLSNMHVNHVGVITIELEEFVLSVQIFKVNVVIDINVLVGQDDAGLHYRITGTAIFVSANIFAFFVLVNSKVEVLL